MCGILLVIAIMIILVLSIGIYQKNTNAVCLSRRRLDGKTVLVTGGTTGIGLEIAKDLAHRGAKVIIACPFMEEGINAKNEIIKETDNDNVEFKHLDLSSLESVRQFAAEIKNTEERLDILINNAGVGVPNDSVTPDGMHFIMQVNYYGTFLLTLHLLPLLKRTGTLEQPSRIVLTSSVMHRLGKMDFENLNRPNYWIRLKIYSNSKLCLILFGNELSRKLKGSNIVINCVDPGAVGTKIFDSGNVIAGFFLKLIMNTLFKTPWQGAQTTLHVVLDKKAGEISGEFYKNCKVNKASKSAYDDKTAKILWEHSKKLVKLSEEEMECLKKIYS